MMKQLDFQALSSNDGVGRGPARKTLPLTLPILLVLVIAFSTMGAAASLTVKIEGIEKLEGVLRVTLVDSKEAYDGSGGVASVQIKVTQSTHTFMLDGLKEGTYALSMMHDVNGNGELDKNVVGMPIEPYAFSNNAEANFGKPKFEDVAFEVVAGANETTVTFPN